GRVFRVDLSGYAGDVTMGETYRGLDHQGVMDKLPYWWSPVSLAPEEAFRRIADDIGAAPTWGYVMDTKMRRTINGWPHLAVPEIEVRKPFLDYGFLEFCAGLPAARRDRSRLHVEILRRYFPALARVPIQQTGVRPDAPRALYYGMAAVRRLHRGARALGLPLAPWVRGAFDFQSWLAPSAVERHLRDALLAPGARVHAYFDAGAIDQVIERTMRTGEIAEHVAFNLLRVEHVLRCLPAWMEPPTAP
ncbi:MAG: hypothetical protein AB7P67_15270, partial [Vicinamibacterales bacterium]